MIKTILKKDLLEEIINHLGMQMNRCTHDKVQIVKGHMSMQYGTEERIWEWLQAINLIEIKPAEVVEDRVEINITMNIPSDIHEVKIEGRVSDGQ